MKKRSGVRVALVTTMLALVALSLPSGALAACKPATNIQAIIDDSGSMLITDFNKLRSEGLKLLISKPSNAKKTIGAVEFGSDAQTVFAPSLVATSAGAMKNAIDSLILGNSGATDYNDGFAKATADNAGAEARLFLTDGGHNEGVYNNGHTPGPPTYVIGLGSSIVGEAAARLQTIADQTGGKYIQVADSTALQAAINEIDAYINCQNKPQTFTDTFTQKGQSKAHSVSIPSKLKSLNLVISWADPADVFVITGIKLKTKNGTISQISRKRARLRIKRVKGRTFASADISRLKRGRLTFRVGLRTKGSVMPSVTLTSQATKLR